VGLLQIQLRETSWVSLAGALQSLGPFGSFLILARLATADELGRYSLADAVTVPVFLAGSIGQCNTRPKSFDRNVLAMRAARGLPTSRSH
jgi:hypothetical protein